MTPLIADSFIAYMFCPSAPTSMSLSDSFILRYVTVSSQATGFTPTTASSADPLSVTAALLHRLGHGCRSYNQTGSQTALHRVRQHSFTAHPPPLHYRIRKGYRVLVVDGTSPSCNAYQRFAPSLGDSFGFGFLQILHWLINTVVPSSGNLHEFLQAPLPSPTYSLLLWAMTGLTPARLLSCRSHIFKALRFLGTILILFSNRTSARLNGAEEKADLAEH